MAFNKSAYDNEWKKQNRDSITIRFPKGNKAKLTAAAKQHGITLVDMIADSLKRCYSIDILEQKREEGD